MGWRDLYKDGGQQSLNIIREDKRTNPPPSPQPAPSSAGVSRRPPSPCHRGWNLQLSLCEQEHIYSTYSNYKQAGLRVIELTKKLEVFVCQISETYI
jgi:hypothetical protein